MFGNLRCVPALAEGYSALEAGDWTGAREFFAAAEARERAPETLEGLGMACFLANEDAGFFEATEAAFELFRKRGDRLGAARAAGSLTVGSFVLRGQPALANGWLRRARTLLEGMDEAPEHGWLEIIEGEKALLLENDGERCAMHGARARGIARRTGDTDLEAYALAIEGIGLVTSGRVDEGLGRLDEAATACLAGEVRAPWVASSVLCDMMDACDRARDWERAREWIDHIARLSERWNDPMFHAQCRPHYAVVLTWRGDWSEAESELQLAIEETTALRPAMAVEGIVRLAELRWRQGRWDEAAALFEQVRDEPIAQVGQAALALDRGDATAALDLLDRALRRLPQTDRLERLPALELRLRVCLALGNLAKARASARELEEMAGAAPHRPVRAAAHLAAGLLAEADGDLDAARMQLEDAVDLYARAGAPFEAARSRLELARVLLALDRAADAQQQAATALETLRVLGAAVETERAERLLADAHGEPTASTMRRTGVSGLTQRELEVLGLLASGLSNQQIAERLVLSIRTVQRHVENIYTKTGARGRAAAAVFAATRDLVPRSDS